MTKTTHLALLYACIIVGLLISPAMAAVAAPGEAIYRPFNGAQERPDIDGNMIVWEDDRYDEQEEGVKDIFLATVDDFRSTLPYSYVGTRITDDPASQEKPSISGDYIAWQDNRHGNWDIYLYQRSTTTTTRLTTDPGNQWLPAICGNYVAWYDDSSGRTNIVLYDIAAGAVKDVIDVNAKTTIPGGTTEFKPALSEQYVAWVEPGDVTVHTYDKVYYYDIAAGSIVGPIAPRPEGDPLPSISQSWPSLSGSFIAWEDTLYRMDPDIYIADIHDPAEGTMLITRNDFDQVSPAIDGGIIVWEDKQIPERSIFMCDLFAVGDFQGEEMCLVEAEDSEDAHLYPAVSGNTIVWQRGRGPNSNLYIFVYQPEAPVERVVTNIDVTPPTATLNVGETEPFSALARDQFGLKLSGVTFTWTSDNATVGTIDDTGRFTAKAAGSATVTATAGNVSGTATVTVNAGEPGGPVATEITITPLTPTVTVNSTVAFEATVRDQFGNVMTGVDVAWDSGNATVGTIDASGLFTARAAGTAIVTATAGTISAGATVTVTTEEPVATSIVVAPTATTLAINGTQQFSATVRDQFSRTMAGVDVTWASSNETVGTIDASGLFTAKAEGTATVTATTGSISGTAAVTVAAEEAELVKIVLFPSEVTLNPGDSRQFEAVPLNRYGEFVPEAAIVWTSSDPCVGTVDECGLFVALCPGTTTLTASGDGATGTTTVTVACNDPVLSRIAVTPPAITLNAGETETFAATAYDQFGCVMPDVDIAWTTCDETVGTIGADGAFTALSAGTTTVTASADCIAGTADVTVTGQPSGIVVSPAAITLDERETRQFTATAFDPEGSIVSGATFAWSCDDETVGTIDGNGLFVALCEGTATITATVEESGEAMAAQVDGTDGTGTAVVTVRSASAVPARIAVSPSDFTIAAGNTLPLTATVYDQYGCVMPETIVVWESSDACIGTIDDCGLFAALEDGDVTITATTGEIAGSACVTVCPPIPVPACIEVDPATTALAPGETQEFVATVYDQCDNELDWVRVAWSCSDSAVGTIDRNGIFTAHAEGSAEVTARAGSVEATAAVAVTAGSTPNQPGNGAVYYSGGDGGSSGPSFDAGTCENLRSGETFTFSGTTSSVDSVSVTAANAIPRLMLTVKEGKAPSGAGQPADDVFEYVEITLNWANPQDIGNATVVFTIPAGWLEEHGMAPEDVVLMRCVNGGWQILETEVIGEENGNYRFRATTPGFSTFAIAAAPVNVTATEETATPTIEETNATVNATVNATGEATTEPTTVPTTPLVYAPLLAPLAFLLWARKNH